MDSSAIPGISVGKVTSVDDPEQLARVRVSFAWTEEPVQRWVSVASPMAGNDRGWFVMPEVNDEVLVAFDQARFDHAYIIGFLWNKQQKPPSPDPRQRMFRSVNGHCIRFIDSPEQDGDKGSIVIESAYGDTIVLSNSHLSITSRGVVQINAATVTIAGRVVRPVGPPI